jgi:hypothetical protein
MNDISDKLKGIIEGAPGPEMKELLKRKTGQKNTLGRGKAKYVVVDATLEYVLKMLNHTEKSDNLTKSKNDGNGVKSSKSSASALPDTVPSGSGTSLAGKAEKDDSTSTNVLDKQENGEEAEEAEHKNSAHDNNMDAHEKPVHGNKWQEKPHSICRHFTASKCKYGAACKFRHPEICKNFINNGLKKFNGKSNKGCDNKCDKIHPKDMCRKSLKFGKCTTPECRFRHVKSNQKAHTDRTQITKIPSVMNVTNAHQQQTSQSTQQTWAEVVQATPAHQAQHPQTQQDHQKQATTSFLGGSALDRKISRLVEQIVEKHLQRLLEA